MYRLKTVQYAKSSDLNINRIFLAETQATKTGCFYYLYNANKNKRIMDSGRFKKALGNYSIKREALLDNLFLMDELVLILFCLH